MTSSRRRPLLADRQHYAIAAVWMALGFISFDMLCKFLSGLGGVDKLAMLGEQVSLGLADPLSQSTWRFEGGTWSRRSSLS